MSKGAILEINGEKFVLKFGKEYLIGRKTNEQFHDIEIDDSSVDIKHSILDLSQNASAQLFDVCSKHGTFVDGVQIAKLQLTLLSKATKISFGNVEASFQLLTESDSGFLEERPNTNTPTKDNSGIICDTPEHVSTSGSRNKNSLTSTPNASTVSNANTSASKSIDNFLLPSKFAPRTSLNSTRSNDSFYIPETQHPQERTHNSTDISVYSNKSKRLSTLNDADDDFFIPETQDVVVKTTIPLSNRARVAFSSDDVNETLSQDDRMPSSQFRICTQDFNGSDEDISNHSGDLLANIPLSMIIPPIQHETVQVDDLPQVDGDDNDFVKSVSDEVDKEMSALQWSKQTIDEIAAADGSVTPDELFDVVGSVTSDLIRVKTPDQTSSQCSTPDFVGNPVAPSIDEILKEIEKEDIEEQEKTMENLSQGSKNRDESTSKPSDENQTKEMEYPPTQAFSKPVTNNLPSRILPQTVAGGNEEDDSEFSLPATQIFSPPSIQSKPALAKVNVSNISLPETQAFTPLKSAVGSNESLPATQLFSPPPKVAEKMQTSSANSAVKDHVFALPQFSPKPRMSLNSQASPRPSPKPKPQATPKSTPRVAPPDDDDDLPPTQVFQKDNHVPVVQKICLSSTLVDSGMQLSENSFKGKFNELLNSDDDEIDEVIAPELVEPVTPSRHTPEEPVAVTPKEPERPEPEKKSPTPASTPVNKNFRMPTKAAKTNASKVSGVSIDHFLLTPDFLGREICKDSQLQREAEVNWRNMVLEKRNKALFDDEKSPDNDFAKIDSDDSQDSFVDLLPKKSEVRTKSLTKTPSTEMPEKKKEVKETVSARITRRKSTFSEVKPEPKKRGRKKKETKNEAAETSVSKEKVKLANEKELKAIEESQKKVEKDSKSDSRNSRSSQKTSLVENSTSKENSSSVRTSVNNDLHSKRKTEANSSAIKKSSDEISKDSVPLSLNSSTDAKDKKSKKVDEGRSTRTRRKVEEKPVPPQKIENEKSTRSRASKRIAEPVARTTSKAAKINKLEEIAIVSKKSSTDEIDKPSPRITRLKSCTESKVEDKKTTTTITKKKEAEPIKVIPPVIKNKIAKADQVVDLTNSYTENGTNKSRKRKSQEDYLYPSRKSQLSGSQSSVGSSDSDRTLRRKKKMKIAMTSCSQATRETLTMYSGRVWDYTEDPKECDVLILEAGNRTYKLLVAIARGVPVVKVDWLKEVIKMRSTDVAFDRYLFDEPNFQKRHQFIMKDVLKLANTKSLFTNLHFMMTPNISPKPDEMKDIITCAGGTILSTIPSPGEDKAFYLVTEKVDCQLWHRYRRASKNVKVITGVSLMASVMQQSLQPLTRVLN